MEQIKKFFNEIIVGYFGNQSKFSTGLFIMILLISSLFSILAGFDILRIFESVIISFLIGILFFFLILKVYLLTIKFVNSSIHSFTNIIPVIIFLSLSAIVLSIPLEVYIFQKEIDKQWEVIKTNEIARAHAASDSIQNNEFMEFENNIKTLVKEKSQNQNIVDQLTQEIYNEMIRGGCGIKCQEYKREIEKKLAKIKELENEILLKEKGKITILKIRQDFVKNAEVKNSGRPGLVDSINALHEYPHSTWPIWSLRLLLMAISILPISIKMMNSNFIKTNKYKKL